MSFIPDRWPRIVTHVLDSESKSVTFGFMLSLTATALFVAFQEKFGADRWMTGQMAASILIGGKLMKEAFLEKGPKEVKPDAATPAP